MQVVAFLLRFNQFRLFLPESKQNLRKNESFVKVYSQDY